MIAIGAAVLVVTGLLAWLLLFDDPASELALEREGSSQSDSALAIEVDLAPVADLSTENPAANAGYLRLSDPNGTRATTVWPLPSGEVIDCTVHSVVWSSPSIQLPL